MIQTQRPWTKAERKQYLETLPRGRAPSAPSGRVVADIALEFFDRVDQNRDGAVCGSELDVGLQSDQFQGERSAALVALRSFLSELQSLHPGDARLTRKDLTVLRESESSQVAASFERSVRLLAELESQPRRPLAEESFDPSWLEQGQLGSCVSLATLMSLSPEEIRSMSTANTDGSVSIRLADGSNHLIKDVSQNERLMHSRTRRGERWPALLELAIGRRLKQLRVGRPVSDQEPRAYLNQGQPPELMFSLLLGYPGRTWQHTLFSPDQARGLLQAGLAEGAVIAGSDQGAGIVDRHAYKVESFDALADRVTLANPWGNEHLSMPYLHFYATFGEMTSGLHQMPEQLRSAESDLEAEARKELLGVGHPQR